MTHEELIEIAKIEKDKKDTFRHRINVCVAAGCLSCQSNHVKEALEKEITRRGLDNWCEVKGVGCLGLCTAGPLISIDPEETRYAGVTVADASEIVDSLGGPVISRLDCSAQSAFFERQQKIVLENC